jgi:hypothetical protein
MKMLKQHFTSLGLLVLFMTCYLSGWAQVGKIHGTVREGKSVMPYATVKLYMGDHFTGRGALTDANGKYEFAMLEPGEYRIQVESEGMKMFSQDVSVSPTESQPMDIQFIAQADDSRDGGTTDTVFIVDKAIFDTDRNVTTLDRRELGQMAIPRDIKTIAATTPGFVQMDHGDPIYYKGARDNANATYFDGIKLRGTDQMPLGAIEQISVLTGGVPAEYGDVLGGVIVVTTRNPSMVMGYYGKPLTKAERQQLRQQKKKGKEESCLDCNLDMACR